MDSQILTTTSRPSVKPWVRSPQELPVLNRLSMPSLPRWRRLKALEQNVSTLTENVNSLTARMCKIETNATSFSSGSDSPRSWNILGHSNGSTGAGTQGSHGPGSSDDSRNTRRRLDTFSSPEDEQARSAVLLRFPCEQYHKGSTKWVNNLWEECNMPAFNKPVKPVRIHCKADSVSVRLVLETRAKCQDLIARCKDDGIPYAIDSPFCCTTTNIIVRQSKSNQLKTDRVKKKSLRLCRENWLTNLKFSSLMEMTKVHSSFHRSMLAHKFSALKIEETELENRCSNLLLLEADKHLPLLHLSFLSLVYLLKCCNVFSQANKVNV